MLHHQISQACFLRLYFLQCYVLSSCCVGVYSVFRNFLIIILRVCYCWCHQENVLHGVMDGETVTDSPHTGFVLIISSKILPTEVRGTAGHAAISSQDQKGHVRAEWTLEHQLGSISCSTFWLSYNSRT